MVEMKLISDLVGVCENVDIYGELRALVELSKSHKNIRWLGGHRNPYDIECDGNAIEVKSCNIDNKWAKKEHQKDPSFESGFDHIDPTKCKYVVCVSFTRDFKNVRFYVFTSEEVKAFDKSDFGRSPNKYVIEIRNHSDGKRNRIIQDSKDAWNRIGK